MIVIGLTGGIASGKSTVSAMFKELGAYIIDYDVLAREVVQPRLKAWQGIVEEFGQEVLNEDLTINRARLGQIVFDEPGKLKRLNKIVHPEIFAEADRRAEEIGKSDPDAVIIKDVPLLIETKIHRKVDRVVVVAVGGENQLMRLAGRGLSNEAARKRIAAQMPIHEKERYADFIIRTDGSIEDTRRQVDEVYGQLCKQARTR
ncbi:MAG: dephospho-CoA kinase [Chloroflexi bacterium]|nr:dephospho-CoA kinase [Chloroflexota bacterium]